MRFENNKPFAFILTKAFTIPWLPFLLARSSILSRKRTAILLIFESTLPFSIRLFVPKLKLVIDQLT